MRASPLKHNTGGSDKSRMAHQVCQATGIQKILSHSAITAVSVLSAPHLRLLRCVFSRMFYWWVPQRRCEGLTHAVLLQVWHTS